MGPSKNLNTYKYGFVLLLTLIIFTLFCSLVLSIIVVSFKAHSRTLTRYILKGNGSHGKKNDNGLFITPTLRCFSSSSHSFTDILLCC